MAALPLLSEFHLPTHVGEEFFYAKPPQAVERGVKMIAAGKWELNINGTTTLTFHTIPSGFETEDGEEHSDDWRMLLYMYGG